MLKLQVNCDGSNRSLQLFITAEEDVSVEREEKTMMEKFVKLPPRVRVVLWIKLNLKFWKVFE